MMKRAPKERLQLRRKRIILLALVALVLVSSPLWAWSVGRPAESGPVARVVVHQQDTLWSIAKQYGPPGQDLRRIVYRIKRVNRLDSSTIHPGAVLLVPQG